MNKVTITGLKNMNMDQIQGLKENDPHAVTDVYLTITNDRKFYEEMKSYIITCQKKISKDTYNYSLAVKGMLNITDRGIKEYYMKIFCNNTNLSSLLSVNDRIIIARDVLDSKIDSVWE